MTVEGSAQLRDVMGRQEPCAGSLLFEGKGLQSEGLAESLGVNGGQSWLKKSFFWMDGFKHEDPCSSHRCGAFSGP